MRLSNLIFPVVMVGFIIVVALPFIIEQRQCLEKTYEDDRYLKVCVEDDTTDITFTGDYRKYQTKTVKAMTDSLQ